MDLPLEWYESQLRLVTDTCEDPWFGEQLALSRAGDEQARRQICGTCLRMVFDKAVRRWRPESQLTLLEFVEEGNAILMKTVRRFAGSTADEFQRQLAQNVDSWYTTLLQHPGWARERRDSWM